MRLPSSPAARRACVLVSLILVFACKEKPVPIVVETPTPPPPEQAPPRDTQPRKPARKPTAKPDTSDAQRFDQIRKGLRQLVVAEQGFFAENGAYTEDFDRLGFRPPTKTSYRFLWLDRDGWAVSGAHDEMPGKDCVIYVGRAASAPSTLRFVRNTREGVPVCDVPPTPPSAGSNPTTVRRGIDTVSALDEASPFIQMRADLRNLVRSQDAYIKTQGLYSRRSEPLALQYLWRPGVRIRILGADGESWSAKATHRTLPGKSCVIWFGPVPLRPTTTAQAKSPERSAIPVCDDSGSVRRRSAAVPQ